MARVLDYEICETASFTFTDLLPDWGAEHEPLLAGLPATLSPDGAWIILSIHSWIVWIDGKIVLIDTGAGNGKKRPFAPYFDQLTTSYLARLQALGGGTPEAVDYVLHTHLHVDHVGWNTRLVDGHWIAIFPNARHVFSAKEYDFFRDPANANARHHTSLQAQQDSVTPIVDAGLADMISIDVAK
ncbi:MBL fold metallo-hydrolase [Breoghania sp.]|uniref:MBL fold metallo-hydrolase n=1 Tax=Breoghania sp. TaxID=2065378 RepID=UPI0026280A8F|nr:MBL fold metallo-hydrolase [Breoghania sp.]